MATIAQGHPTDHIMRIENNDIHRLSRCLKETIDLSIGRRKFGDMFMGIRDERYSYCVGRSDLALT
jgi:hypothetical protein